MSIVLHELSHTILALIPSVLIIKQFKLTKKKSFFILIIGLLGGFFIDLDHLIDYYFAFGLKFNPTYFFKGYQFLKSDKIFVFFHTYELIFFFLIASLIIKKKSLFVFLLLTVLAVSMSFHIFFDVFENELPPQTYSLIYRQKNNFDIKKLVYPSHYRYHLEQKKKIKL